MLGLHRHHQQTAHSVAPSLHTGALSDALQRVLCQAGARPPFHVLYKPPGALLRALFLISQRYFLAVGSGPVPGPPVARSLCRAFSAYGRFIQCTAACSLPGQGEAAPLRPLQVPWGCAPYLGSCSPALLHHCGCRACTDIASGLHTPLRPQRTQRYFLVVGAGPAPTPPADRAFRSALSAHRRFVRCTVVYSPPGRGETALQCPLQVPWGRAPCLVPHSPVLLPCYGCRARAVTAGGPRTPLRPQRTRVLYPMHCSMFFAMLGEIALQRPPLASAGAADRVASPCESLASTTGASPTVPAPARPPRLWDRTPPRSSGPQTPLGTDSPGRWSLKVG
ncbi:hypothetical protein NDU88_003444 [Pleurodeles waltl]|uniref:Uncharacterized protein n=1 Tax=Pleurodeles waltl TaxID=8319 RepID=A0AAV7T549_PLEWA|nr:hypothetical protein NDU88_003444 [Pleurodeles waltl]